MRRLSKRRMEVLREYGVRTVLREYKRLALPRPHEELQPYRHGQLSASQAKKDTNDKSIVDNSSAFYYNMIDNWIDDHHHNVVTTDIHANNLIEQDKDNNKLIWHGDVCVVCKQPPCTWGEILLAQYGHTDFICVDCGKVVDIQNRGMKGFHHMQSNKKTFKPIKQEDEEDEC